MKVINKILIMLLGVSLFASCQEKLKLEPNLISVNVVNASINVSSVKVNYLGTSDLWKILNDQVSYGTNRVYSVFPDKHFKIVSATDTLTLLYNKTFKKIGDIYSLFLAGQSTAVDTILVKENIPYRADSTAGVRFINLSYNSTPVNVTLSTTATVNEFSAVAYKGITDFKTYPALKANTSYIFQVKDGSTNALLVSYTLTTPRFANCTLVLKGMVGGTGTNALGVQRVNNY